MGKKINKYYVFLIIALTVFASLFESQVSVANPVAGLQEDVAEILTSLPVSVQPGPHGTEAHMANFDINPLLRGANAIRLQMPDGILADFVQDGFEARDSFNSVWRGQMPNT